MNIREIESAGQMCVCNGRSAAGSMVCGVALLVMSVCASGQDTVEWVGGAPGSAGDWFTASNWSPQLVPTANACLQSGVNPINCNVQINGGNGVPTLSGSTLIGALRMGQASGQAGSLVVGGGGVLNSSSTVAWIGAAAGGVGNVLVKDGGQIIVAGVSAASGNYRIGNSGLGTLTLQTGGSLNLGGGAGRLALAFAEGSEGRLIIGADVGSSAVSAGTASVGNIWFGSGQGTVIFNHTDSAHSVGASFITGSTVAVGGVITQRGAIDFLSGTTILTGSTTQFSGAASVRNGGKLVLGGTSFGHTTATGGNTMVLSVQNGTLAVSNSMASGRAAATRTIYGNLALSGDAVVEFGLGLANSDPLLFGAGDLIKVTGDLTLDGTLKVFDLGGFSFGRYELFNYGTLNAASNLDILDLLPNGLNGSLVDDASNKRIMLVIEASLGTQVYWIGGDGIWNSTLPNWTNESGSLTAEWNSGAAIFAGSGSTVSVEETGLAFTGINFEGDVGSSPYRIVGNGGNLVATPEDDQTIVGLSVFAGTSAEIEANILDATDATRIRKYNNGTLILSGNGNDWKGGTTIDAGVLQIGNGGTSGHLPGNVTINGGVLAFNRSNSYTYAGVIDGGGAVRQSGAGTTILTANNLYAGATQVNAGTLQVGNGTASGALGAGAVSITAGATLAFNRTGDFTFGNAVSGAGSLAQRGGGTLLLSGNLNSFTGKLLAENGVIQLGTGSAFTGSVDVGNGGTLKGVRRIGNTRILAGGTLAPGNSIGTIEVVGQLTFATGSTYEVEVNEVGGHDLVQVIGGPGKLVIDGGMVSVLASNAGAPMPSAWRPYNTYTILTHLGAREGEFDGVTSNFAFLTPELNYGVGAVTLTLNRNDINFAAIGVTPNQIAAGAATEALSFNHPIADAALALVDSVLILTPEEARAAFDSLSGQMHASVRNVLLDDSRLVRDAILSQSFVHARQSDQSQLWMRALGHQGAYEGDGVSETKRDAAGIVLGLDSPLGESGIRMGWAVGYHMNSEIKADDIQSEGEANNTHVALYGSFGRASGMGGRMGLAHTWHEVDVNRTVAFTGYEERLSSSYDGRSLQAFAEVDYGMQLNGANVSPFLGLSWVRLETDDFMEIDFRTPIGSTAALRSGDWSHNASFASVGARGDISLGMFSIQGKLGYRRVISGDDPVLKLAYVDGAQTFDISGVPLAKDSVVADLGFGIAFSERFQIGASYNGLLAADARDHAIEARLVWTLE